MTAEHNRSKAERKAPAVADTPADPRDDSVIVAVVNKRQLDGSSVKDGISPGLVTLGWLRFGDNAEKWVEIDQTTGKKVTAAQVAKAVATTGQEG